MTYVVKSGDTVYNIAIRYNTTISRILALNPGLNPSLIVPGQTLNLPDTTQPSSVAYTIIPGDTLYKIAARFGVSVQLILSANPQITNMNLIYPGLRITIPLQTQPPGCILMNFFNLSTNTILTQYIDPQGAKRTTLPLPPGSDTPGIVNAPASGGYISYLLTGNLYISDQCGKNLRQLAKNVLSYGNPWSYDGTMLAYCAQPEAPQNNRIDLFVSDLSGNTKKISEGAEYIACNTLVWISGNRQLGGIVGGINPYIVVYDIASGVSSTKPIPYTPVADSGNTAVLALAFGISPSGRYVVYSVVSRSGSALILQDAFIHDFATGSTVRLPTPTTAGIKFRFVDIIKWSPDSNYIAYSVGYTDAAGINGITLWISDTRGNLVKSFDPRYEGGYRYVWSPDSKYLSYSNPTGLYVFSVKAGTSSRIISLPYTGVGNPESGIELLSWIGGRCPIC